MSVSGWSSFPSLEMKRRLSSAAMEPSVVILLEMSKARPPVGPIKKAGKIRSVLILRVGDLRDSHVR